MPNDESMAAEGSSKSEEQFGPMLQLRRNHSVGGSISCRRTEGVPRCLHRHVDDGRLGGIRRGKDGEKDNGFAEGIVGAVDLALGDEDHFAGLQHALLASAPLLRLSADDVDDLLARGMVVEWMVVARSHRGADHEQLAAGHDVGTAEPGVERERRLFRDGLGRGDKAAGLDRVVGHGARWFQEENQGAARPGREICGERSASSRRRPQKKGRRSASLS